MSDRKVRNDTEAAMAFVLATESGQPLVVEMWNGDRFEVTAKKIEEPEIWWEYWGDEQKVKPLMLGFTQRFSIIYNADSGVTRAVFKAKASEKDAKVKRIIKAATDAFEEV